MVVIEFFSETPIDNMISTLTSHPDKVILVGQSKIIRKNGKARIDTCTNKKFRESYQESIENYQSRIKEKTEQYEEINNMKFSEYKKLAISEMQSSSDEASSHATWTWCATSSSMLISTSRKIPSRPTSTANGSQPRAQPSVPTTA